MRLPGSGSTDVSLEFAEVAILDQRPGIPAHVLPYLFGSDLVSSRETRDRVSSCPALATTRFCKLAQSAVRCDDIGWQTALSQPTVGRAALRLRASVPMLLPASAVACALRYLQGERWRGSLDPRHLSDIDSCRKGVFL